MTQKFNSGRQDNSGRPLRFSGDAVFIAHRRSALRVDEAAFTAFAAPSADGLWRFAAVASKRVGGAVERNRAKRRLRAAFAQVRKGLPSTPALSVILYAKVATLRAPFEAIGQSLGKVFERAANPR